jgi:lambda family phage portal protein
MGLRKTAGRFLYRAAAAVSGYNAATGGRRTIKIGQTGRGVNNLALSEGDQLLRMARKAALDNPYAVVGIGAFIGEVVGTGIRPHSRHPNPDVRRNLEREFSLWTAQSSATRRIGPGGKPDSLQNFFTQEMLVCRNLIEAGEAFARLRPRLASDLSPDGLRVPLQIDLIEPEQLAFWRMSGDMASPDNLVRASIEFDQIHQRVAYHFYREHPGDSTLWPNTFEVVRVPADQVLHCMEFVRGNQIRGITGLAPILVQLDDLEGYDDGERFRQRLGSYLFAWKKTATPDDPQLANVANSAGNETAPQGAAFVESQPGAITVIDTNANEEMGFYSHPGVPGTYEPFMRIQRQTIAAVLRVTYGMLTGDHSSTTFMNARVDLLKLRRIWEQFQKAVLVHQFCRPTWRAWCDAAALVGIINSSDYRKNPEQYLDVEWLPQPWEWVDPAKDVDTVRKKIESCLTSRAREVAKLSGDIEQIDAEIRQDHDREAALGIVPVYGASRATEAVPPGDDDQKQTGDGDDKA